MKLFYSRVGSQCLRHTPSHRPPVRSKAHWKLHAVLSKAQATHWWRHALGRFGAARWRNALLALLAALGKRYGRQLGPFKVLGLARLRCVSRGVYRPQLVCPLRQRQRHLEAAATSSAKRPDLQPPCFSSLPSFVPSHRCKSELCMCFFFSSFNVPFFLFSFSFESVQLSLPPYSPTLISSRLLSDTFRSIPCTIASISAQQPHSSSPPAAHVRHMSRPKGGVRPELQSCSRTLAHSHLSI